MFFGTFRVLNVVFTCVYDTSSYLKNSLKSQDLEPWIPVEYFPFIYFVLEVSLERVLLIELHNVIQCFFLTSKLVRSSLNWHDFKSTNLIYLLLILCVQAVLSISYVASSTWKWTWLLGHTACGKLVEVGIIILCSVGDIYI